MNGLSARTGIRRTRKFLPITATLLASVLFCQAVLPLTSNAQASQRAAKKSAAMSGDQRIAHVLSRLTFGARQGDFERVKAMGVESFINQQLDPDSIDAGAVIARQASSLTLIDQHPA